MGRRARARAIGSPRAWTRSSPSCASAPRPRGLAVNALRRLDRDAFGKQTPFRAAIEVAGGDSDDTVFEDLFKNIGAQIADVAHPDLSTLLVGSDVVFVEPPPRSPVRYQYLMRRNASFTHESYLERYRAIHSRFGSHDAGDLGYVQFHVDLGASQRIATRAGLGVMGVRQRLRAPSRVSRDVPARARRVGLRHRADRRRRGLRRSRTLARPVLCGRLGRVTYNLG